MQLNRRCAAVGALMVLAVAGGAWAGAEKYTLTPVVTAQASHGAPAPGAVNGRGVVAGACQWTNTAGFVWDAEHGASALAPGGGVLFMGVRGVSESGDVVFDGCVPPPGGNGACGAFLARHRRGEGTVRIDSLPGGPTGAMNWPVKVNSAGSVALSSREWHTPGVFSTVKVYSDAGGWRDVSSELPVGSYRQHDLIDFNDAGQSLVWVGGLNATYLHTPGAGAAEVLPSGWNALDMNNHGEIVGYRTEGQTHRGFRASAAGGLTLLDPSGTLPGAVGRVINDAGVVAGTWDGGFFVHTPEGGLRNLGRPAGSAGTSLAAAQVTAINGKGEFVGFELSNIYENRPVIKLTGRPIMLVQEEIDPGVREIEVRAVTGLNDAGQLVVSGVAPGTQDAISMLATPRGCAADFDGSGTVTVQDVFTFLGAYFGGEARADVDGAAGLGVGDVFAFLGAYFAGCAG